MSEISNNGTILCRNFKGSTIHFYTETSKTIIVFTVLRKGLRNVTHDPTVFPLS